jgi:hypothetical protein
VTLGLADGHTVVVNKSSGLKGISLKIIPEGWLALRYASPFNI